MQGPRCPQPRTSSSPQSRGTPGPSSPPGTPTGPGDRLGRRELRWDWSARGSSRGIGQRMDSRGGWSAGGSSLVGTWIPPWHWPDHRYSHGIGQSRDPGTGLVAERFPAWDWPAGDAHRSRWGCDPCQNVLRHLGGSAPLLQGWLRAEGTQLPPFWGATGTGRTRLAVGHGKASGRLAPGEPSGSAPPNKPGCKQSHQPSAFGGRPQVRLGTPKACDTGERSPEERGRGPAAPRSVTAGPALPGTGASGEAALGRLGSKAEAGSSRPPGVPPRGWPRAPGGVAVTREAWDEQGAAGSAMPQRAAWGQRSPPHVTALQGHGERAQVPPAPQNASPSLRPPQHPPGGPGGMQPLPPPCQLCPHRPQPGTPGDGPRPRCPSPWLGAGPRSSLFCCFPLKNKTADASLGRFLSQEHSPKTSAPGPALVNLTLCVPGRRLGGGHPTGPSPLINPGFNH